uniref:N-acetyltransferase ESCO1 n=1 Tax=Parastrongyloides trichosuri TaxID=131310 RepID=A0A0N4ZP72_PARTI
MSSNLITNYFTSKNTSKKRPRLEETNEDKDTIITKNKKRVFYDTDKNQQRLDFGQRNIGPVYCRACDTMYEQTNPEDVKAHEKYHNRHTTLDSFKVTLKQINNWKKLHLFKEYDGKLFFHIKKSSRSTLINKIEEILKNTLNNELGNEVKNPWGTKISREGYAYIHKVSDKIFFIGGISFVEYLKEAKNCSNKVVAKGNFLGLYFIWIHPLIRRRKIGTELLDVIREIHIPSINFTKRHILIDHSTEDFKNFISSYTNMHISEILLFTAL